VDHAELAQIAAVVGAAGCAVLLVLRGRVAYLAGLVVIGVAEALLAWSLVPSEDLRVLVDSPPRIAAVAVGAAAVAGAGAVLARFPFVVPIVALAATPFRVPVGLGDQEAFLLLPLYAVISAAAIGLAVRTLRGAELEALPRVVSWPGAAFVSFAAISLLWSEDLRAGTIDLLFFLFPFVVLVAVLARAPYGRALPRALATTQVALALLFTAVGIWQLWSERLFFAKDLEVANAYTDYFRTTSVFADSSLYGLQLVLGIVVLLVALWVGGLGLLTGTVLIAALWAGLYFSYSQSSMVALVVAALAVGLAAAGWRSRAVIAAGAALFALAAVGLGVAVVKGDSAERVTSGRAGLVSDTARVFLNHPVVGVGIGSQARASREEAGGKRETRLNESHTTPLTVAAEGGVVGLALYVASLLGAARLLSAVHRARPVLGLGLAGCFIVLFVHSLLYSGFFEDPITWGAIGVAAAALAPRGRRSEATVPSAATASAAPTHA
jgi:putative inorganic carbon (HCO3(-)) transporter